MNGKIRIEREPGITDLADGKQIYIPVGANFRAANGSQVAATVTTSQSGIIQADQSDVVLDATEFDNFAGIVIGATDHSYRQSYCSSDQSPEKPDGMCDWKQACLIATPVAPFTE